MRPAAACAAHWTGRWTTTASRYDPQLYGRRRDAGRQHRLGDPSGVTTQWRQGQYLSRFFFLALSCASGTGGEGNLLDKVWVQHRAGATGHGQRRPAADKGRGAGRLPHRGRRRYKHLFHQAARRQLYADYADAWPRRAPLRQPARCASGLRGLQSVTIGNLPSRAVSP